MQTGDYLALLVDQIHSVVVATLDGEGKPATRVIDLMYQDGQTAYFLTANTKPFYQQLKEKPYISVTGMTQGADTMERKMVSLTGKVEHIGKEKLAILLEKNPYMFDIYPTKEAEWAYWAKHIYHNRYEDHALPLYQKLYQLVKDKDYFVITTNVDGQFKKASFAADRFFGVQGNYGQFQCSIPCQQVVYDDKSQVYKMMQATNSQLEIPSQLLPTCSNCGAPLTRHLRVDNRFVQDNNWYQEQKRYGQFLEDLDGKKVVFLELGVGYNTPTIIRYPFEQLTYQLPQAKLIRLNLTDTLGVEENKNKTITISDQMEEVFDRWLSSMN